MIRVSSYWPLATGNWQLRWAFAGLTLLAAFALPLRLDARPRVSALCSVMGQTEQRLVGMGIVTGLKGTGDGDKFLPTLKAMGSALSRFEVPIKDPAELKAGKNFAIVLVTATIPKEGAFRGQRLDCSVTSIGSAKSLEGGELLVTPLGNDEPENKLAFATAAGAIRLDSKSPNRGVISSGTLMVADVYNEVVHDDRFRLLIHPDLAGFQSASEISSAINTNFSVEAGGREVARPLAPSIVEVAIPEGEYRKKPLEFIANVLSVSVDNPQQQARVVVNSRTGTVVVSADVEISPVVFGHKNLAVQIGDTASTTPEEPVPGIGFVAIQDQQAQISPVKLKDLVDALNQLKVPTEDVVEILKHLRQTGRLHAELLVVE
jgi:flagellar P-ring protein precursor FlgI